MPTQASRPWREIVSPYAKPNTRRAVIELLATGLPFVGLMAGLLWGIDNGLWPMLALGIPAAALLVRLFMIQHDCGHGSFFASRRANDLLGHLLGVATLTPYVAWRRSHAIHHASVGNLDRRGIGDVTTLTVREYLSCSGWRRFVYRLYRNPLVLFGIGPAWQFLVVHRVPTGSPLLHWQGWLSVLGTDAALATVAVPLLWIAGPYTVLLVCLPVLLLAAAAGVWLFYVQHQFEEVYWRPDGDWAFQAAALQGSSFYDLPAILRWVTANIGFHHIHHLSSRIPSYRLRACFEENPELRRAPRLTLLSSLKCMRLAVWDDTQRKLLPFRELRRRR
jgi:acyl-lipid omega-6 desaturase (Delta-12 desaturase)